MILRGAALLVLLLEADAGSTGFISVSNGAFVDGACTEFIPVGWNSCAPSASLLVASSRSEPHALLLDRALHPDFVMITFNPSSFHQHVFSKLEGDCMGCPHRHHDMRALVSLAI